MRQFDMRQFDMRQFDMPQFDVPQFDMRVQCDPPKWLSCGRNPIAFDLRGYCALAPVGAFCG